MIFSSSLVILCYSFYYALSLESSCNVGNYTFLQKNQNTYIKSPGFNETSTYPRNAFCSWTIGCAPNRKLMVSFELLSIWPTFNCALDGLVLFNGNSTNAPILGKFCSLSGPAALMTTGSFLHVVFYTSDFIQPFYQGFRIKVQDVPSPATCNNSTDISCHNGKCVSRSKRCNYKDDCGDGTDEESCDYRMHYNLTCGVTPISPELENDDRIVGGKAAVPGSWPWQVSLRRRGRGPAGHLCGAVLIDALWLISAAHCFRNLNNASLWTAHFGKYYKYQDESTEQVRYLEKIIIHPEYVGNIPQNEYSKRKDSDLALLKLNAFVTMRPNVRPVCLPPSYAFLAAGTLCHVTGWGAVLGTGNADVLKQAAVPIVANKKCRSYYNSLTVTDSMICAGYETGGQDSCQGDSGGPLVLLKSHRWYLVGIVSTGGNCAEPLQPGIYTRVSAFKSWIVTNMRLHETTKKTQFNRRRRFRRYR